MKSVRLNESSFRKLVEETTKRIINEIGLPTYLGLMDASKDKLNKPRAKRAKEIAKDLKDHVGNMVSDPANSKFSQFKNNKVNFSSDGVRGLKIEEGPYTMFFRPLKKDSDVDDVLNNIDAIIDNSPVYVFTPDMELLKNYKNGVIEKTPFFKDSKGVVRRFDGKFATKEAGVSVDNEMNFPEIKPSEVFSNWDEIRNVCKQFAVEVAGPWHKALHENKIDAIVDECIKKLKD